MNLAIPLETVRCEINSIRYSKESKKNTFFLIANSDIGIIKGNIAWVPEIGELLKLSGNWETYQGEQQFAFKNAMPDVPITERGKLHYVCQLSVGFGEATELKIWETFRENWGTSDLMQIKGITKKKLKSFQEAKEKIYLNEAQLSTIAWLLEKGCTFNMAMSAWEEFGKDTIGIVSANPYKLSSLPHYSFKQVDNMRDMFGIAYDSEMRIKSGIEYTLKQLTNSGDTIIQWNQVKEQAWVLLGAELKQEILNYTAKMINEKSIIGWRDSGNMALYSIAEAEIKILEYVNGD